MLLLLCIYNDIQNNGCVYIYINTYIIIIHKAWWYTCIFLHCTDISNNELRMMINEFSWLHCTVIMIWGCPAVYPSVKLSVLLLLLHDHLWKKGTLDLWYTISQKQFDRFLSNFHQCVLWTLHALVTFASFFKGQGHGKTIYGKMGTFRPLEHYISNRLIDFHQIFTNGVL